MKLATNKILLVGLTLDEIKKALEPFNFPKFAAKEIALWIYRRGARSFQEMSNISKTHQTILNDNFELGLFINSKVNNSADGTKKYLFPVKISKFIETAFIPEKSRNTLCVSTQVGCKMGCLFCMTGKQGFQGNLTAGEIVNQVLSIPERETITNIVFMGMGEPFDNTDEVLRSLEILTADWGLGINMHKITVSTIGIIPGMKRFIEESRCQLAISMHSPFDEERALIMPVENIYPIKEVVSVLKNYYFERNRRISFEYILFKGLNDSDKHVAQIAKLLNGIKCRINLIHFHAIPGTPLVPATIDDLLSFRNKLVNKGITTTVRASRGEDILAACGLLSTKELVPSRKTELL